MLEPRMNMNGAQLYREVTMPCKHRFILPGEPQPVIIRYADRKYFFYTEEE